MGDVHHKLCTSAQQSGPWVGRLTNSHSTQSVTTANPPFLDQGVIVTPVISAIFSVAFDNIDVNSRIFPLFTTFMASCRSPWRSCIALGSPCLLEGVVGEERRLPAAARGRSRRPSQVLDGLHCVRSAASLPFRGETPLDWSGQPEGALGRNASLSRGNPSTPEPLGHRSCPLPPALPMPPIPLARFLAASVSPRSKRKNHNKSWPPFSNARTSLQQRQ